MSIRGRILIGSNLREYGFGGNVKWFPRGFAFIRHKDVQESP